MFCRNCGKELKLGEHFCPECGTEAEKKIGEPEKPVLKPAKAEAPAAVSSSDVFLRAKKSHKKLIVGMLCGVFAFVVVAVLAFHFLNKEVSFYNIALYEKGGELWLSKLESGKIEDPLLLSSRLCEPSGESSGVDDNPSYYLRNASTLSSNGKYLFFPDHAEMTDSYTAAYDLNFLDFSDKDLQPQKIAGEVRKYTLIEDGKKVVYVDEDDILYTYDIKKEEKSRISTEVASIYVDKQTGKTIFTNTVDGKDYSMFYYDGGNNVMRLDYINRIVEVADDLSAVYYLRDGYLCRKSGDLESAEREKLFQIELDDNGFFCHYLSDDSSEIEGYFLDSLTGGLNYFKDDSVTSLSEHEVYPPWGFCAKDFPLVVFKETPEDIDEPVFYKIAMRDNVCDFPLSEIDQFSLTYNSDYIRWDSTTIASDGTAIYYMTDIDSLDAYYGTLCRLDMQSESLFDGTNVEDAYYDLFDFYQEVYYMSGYPTHQFYDKNFGFFYYKNTNFEPGENDNISEDIDYARYYSGDLYLAPISGVEIFLDRNVCMSKVDCRTAGREEDKQNLILYFTNWIDERECGSLKIKTVIDSEPQGICENVNSYEITPNGEILYLYDYSAESERGSLGWYDVKNGEPYSLDDDVDAILPITVQQEVKK